jgi:hypothetical protein
MWQLLNREDRYHRNISETLCPDRADPQVREPSDPESTELRVCPYGEDRVWAGELTFVPTHTGRLTLAVQLDFYSQRVVGKGDESAPNLLGRCGGMVSGVVMSAPSSRASAS